MKNTKKTFLNKITIKTSADEPFDEITHALGSCGWIEVTEKGPVYDVINEIGQSEHNVKGELIFKCGVTWEDFIKRRTEYSVNQYVFRSYNDEIMSFIGAESVPIKYDSETNKITHILKK